MLTPLRPALTLFVLLSIITGIVYPLSVTAIAQVAFHDTANGSLIDRHGTVVGSSLIGQSFTTGNAAADARWFWTRPSATSPIACTALNTQTGTGSSGSNLAPSNPALVDAVKQRIEALAASDAAVGGIKRPAGQKPPVDLVTASASGLDPHISPAAAVYQLPRVARARGISEASLEHLVARHTTGRFLGVLGEPVVNVLELNLELDSMQQW